MPQLIIDLEDFFLAQTRFSSHLIDPQLTYSNHYLKVIVKEWGSIIFFFRCLVGGKLTLGRKKIGVKFTMRISKDAHASLKQISDKLEIDMWDLTRIYLNEGIARDRERLANRGVKVP